MQLLALFASLSASAVALAQPVAITNVTVIDADRGTSSPGQVIVIDGERITAVADAATVRLGGDVKVLDGSGLFAFPGLIDSHVHYVDPSTYGPLLIAYGVTLVRDMGGSTEQILAQRDRLNRAEELGPRMVATGAIIDGDPPVWPFSEPCDTPEDARAAVRKLKAAGADFIKVYSLLKPDVYLAAVDEARKVGLKAVGHVPDSITLAQAAAAGQHTNEHMMRAEGFIVDAAPPLVEDPNARRGLFSTWSGWLRYPEADKAKISASIKDFAESGMVQCPTLVVQIGIAAITDGSGPKDPRMETVQVAMKDFWSGERYQGYSRLVVKAIPHMKAILAGMHKAGVPLIAGTDLANPHVYAGASLHDELKLFVEAGMTPAQALRSATALPARVHGLESDYGSISAGRIASIVLTDADPLADIANAARIRHVYLAGRHFDRAALDDLMKQAKDTAGTSPADQPGDALAAAGEIIARGTYAMKFGQFDAGTEEFVISKTADGFHIATRNIPKGGMQVPSESTIILGPDHSFRSASWKTLTASPTVAAYTLDGGVLKGRAVTAGKDQPPQDFELKAESMINPPIMASEFMTVNLRPMKVGERIEAVSVSWGMNSWKIESAPIIIERKADATIRRGDADVGVRNYTGVMTTQFGKFETESWVDERGIMIKGTLKMPFGVVSYELK